MGCAYNAADGAAKQTDDKTLKKNLKDNHSVLVRMLQEPPLNNSGSNKRSSPLRRENEHACPLKRHSKSNEGFSSNGQSGPLTRLPELIRNTLATDSNQHLVSRQPEFLPRQFTDLTPEQLSRQNSPVSDGQMQIDEQKIVTNEHKDLGLRTIVKDSNSSGDEMRSTGDRLSDNQSQSSSDNDSGRDSPLSEFELSELCRRLEGHCVEDCERGFFRRSIQQKIQYRPCSKNQQCSILRVNRNRCQYCRLKKCIAVGMSRDAVRFGRVPKREKARILAAMQQQQNNSTQQHPSSVNGYPTSIQRPNGHGVPDHHRLLGSDPNHSLLNHRLMQGNTESGHTHHSILSHRLSNGADSNHHALQQRLSPPNHCDSNNRLLDGHHRLVSDQHTNSLNHHHQPNGEMNHCLETEELSILQEPLALMRAVTRAHLQTCEFTKERVKIMKENNLRLGGENALGHGSNASSMRLACPLNPSTPPCTPPLSPSHASHPLLAMPAQDTEEFSHRFSSIIRDVIDFANSIPGFSNLGREDKFTLLKSGLFDALFVRLIKMFDAKDNSVICLNGKSLTRDSIRCPATANAERLVDSTFEFAEKINSLDLSDTEVALFSAVVLISPDRHGLKDRMFIEKIHESLLRALKHTRLSEIDFVDTLLNLIPDIRTLSTLHTEKLIVFRTEHKEQLLRQQLDDNGIENNIEQLPNGDHKDHPVADNAEYRDQLLKRGLEAENCPMYRDQLLKRGLESEGPMEYRDQYIKHPVDYPMKRVNENGCGVEYREQLLKPVEYRSEQLIKRGNSMLDNNCPVEYREQMSYKETSPLLAASLTGTSPRLRANSGSSGDEEFAARLAQNGLTITAVNGQRILPGYRKLDSPTDSGIESGNEKPDNTRNAGSSCSSPRSSNELQISHVQPNNDDMPVLKRVLQAPPLYDTNSLMDEAYKPHKKFRAMRQKDVSTTNVQTTSENGASNGQSQLQLHLTRPLVNQQMTQQKYNLSSTHSELARSLRSEPRMTPEQAKRADIIQNYLARAEAGTQQNSLTPQNISYNFTSVIRSPARRFQSPHSTLSASPEPCNVVEREAPLNLSKTRSPSPARLGSLLQA